MPINLIAQLPEPRTETNSSQSSSGGGFSLSMGMGGPDLGQIAIDTARRQMEMNAQQSAADVMMSTSSQGPASAAMQMTAGGQGGSTRPDPSNFI